MLEQKDLEMVGNIVTEIVTDIVTKTVEPLKRDIREVQMTLENEINPKISIIAEGHLDLSRKLNEVLKSDAEREQLNLRVTSLENEMRRVKKRIEEIA